MRLGEFPPSLALADQLLSANVLSTAMQIAATLAKAVLVAALLAQSSIAAAPPISRGSRPSVELS